MKNTTILNFIKDVLINMPSSWLNLTTHRLDIYDEKLAKTQFLEQVMMKFCEIKFSVVDKQVIDGT